MLITKLYPTLCDPMDSSPPGSSVHSCLEFSSKNTRVGCPSLLQGIFPTQGSNPGLLHCRWILYQLCHMGSSRILEWVAYPFSRGLPDPGIEPRSLTLQADSLPAVPQGKPKNTGLGSLSLLQQVFPTQGLNPDLPHCRQILYQLSHQGNPC